MRFAGLLLPATLAHAQEHRLTGTIKTRLRTRILDLVLATFQMGAESITLDLRLPR